MTDKELHEARELIAGFLKSRREELGITQEELALKTSMGVSTIKRFENAHFWPVLKHFIKICEVLKIVPSTIPFGGSAEFIKMMRKEWRHGKK